MMPGPGLFYLHQEESLKSCFFALRSLILKQDPALSETIKYGMPCFLYQKNIFCYLWSDKKTGEAYILFAEGKQLDHPQLESGNRARMKILRVKPGKDLPVKTINEVIKRAVALYKTGSVKLKK